MQTTSLRHAQRGFTLLEVLMAALLVSSLAVVAAISLNRSNSALHESTSLTHAQTVANNTLEQVRQAAYSGASLCDANVPADAVTVNGTTYHPEVTLEYRYEDAAAAGYEAVDCADARAVHVTVDVTWTSPSGQDTLSNQVATTISLVDLEAPSLATLLPDQVRVAQGQRVDLTWHEGNTLPIPEYTFTAPSDTQPGFTITWNGPSPWLGGEAQKELDLTGPDGFELRHTVTRARSNTASFIALRNGVHTFRARNIVGDTVAQVDANVVQEPEGHIPPPSSVLYGDPPLLTATILMDGYDDEVRITASGPKGYEQTLTGNLPLNTPIEFGPGAAQAPELFPARYTVAVENLYTDTWGATPRTSADLDVQCYAPQLDEHASDFTREAWAGDAYYMYLSVLPNNVPDLVVTATRNGDPVAHLAPAAPPSPAGHAPIEYAFRVTAGPAGQIENWRFEVSSVMCQDRREVYEIPVEVRVVSPPDPDVGVGGASCSVRIKNTYFTQRAILVEYAGSPRGGSITYPAARGGKAHFTGAYEVTPTEGEIYSSGHTAGNPVTFQVAVIQEIEYWGHDGKKHTSSVLTCSDKLEFNPPSSWVDETEEEEEEEGGGGSGGSGGSGGTGGSGGDGDEEEPEEEDCGWEIIDGTIVDTCN